MTAVNKNLRSKQGAKRVDLTGLREVLRDRRCWACMGLIVKGDDGSHFELDATDVLVEVESVPDGKRMTARLGSLAGGPGRGVWAIPPVGTEVAMIVPEGSTEFGPIIVGTLSTGEVPSELDETIVVMSNNLGDIAVVPMGDLKLGDNSATEAAIRGNSFKVTFDAFVTKYNAHSHTAHGVVTTTQATAMPSSDLSDKVKVQ